MDWGEGVVAGSIRIDLVRRIRGDWATHTEVLIGRHFNRILEHLSVQHQLKRGRSERGKVSNNDILRDTAQVIHLGEGSSLSEHVDRLFERASHEGTSAAPVDTVATHSE